MILVDTNVLLDVAGNDPQWADWSLAQLDRLSLTNRLVINPVIYAELSIGYERIEEVEAALVANRYQSQRCQSRRPKIYAIDAFYGDPVCLALDINNFSLSLGVLAGFSNHLDRLSKLSTFSDLV